MKDGCGERGQLAAWRRDVERARTKGTRRGGAHRLRVLPAGRGGGEAMPSRGEGTRSHFEGHGNKRHEKNSDLGEQMLRAMSMIY